ncbi:MAG TPA: hypothetical protein VGF15_03900, partial [Solirubrobacteraceae bacterium]
GEGKPAAKKPASEKAPGKTGAQASGRGATKPEDAKAPAAPARSGQRKAPGSAVPVAQRARSTGADGAAAPAKAKEDAKASERVPTEREKTAAQRDSGSSSGHVPRARPHNQGESSPPSHEDLARTLGKFRSSRTSKPRSPESRGDKLKRQGVTRDVSRPPANPKR